MRCKSILLTILLVSTVTAQSFFNRALGNEFDFLSARAVAIGNTVLSNDLTSSTLLSNPANMATFKDELSLDFNLNSKSTLERRRMDMKDSFGDFLVTGDYVQNSSINNYLAGGVVYKSNFRGFDFGVGGSYSPLASFDYKYEEEVRGSASLEDGEIGIKDPIVGYHIFETEGVLNRISFGVGIGVSPPQTFSSINFGFTLHNVIGSELTEKFYTDSLSADVTNLSLVNKVNNKLEIPKGKFFSLSTDFNLLGLNLIFGYESDMILQTPTNSTVQVSDSVGLPIYIEQDSDYSVQYIIEGLNYTKPSIINLGFGYRFKDTVPMSISFEINRIYTSNKLNGYELNNITKLKMGFEYVALNEIPVRAGFIFSNSPFQNIQPESVFTFGTGKTFGKLTVDIAGAYHTNSYNYPDIFPVEDDDRPDYDTVLESNFNLVTTFQYKF